MIEVKDIREGVLEALKQNPSLTKYKLAKDLNLSTATHVNNFITGKTKKTRWQVMNDLFKKYDILVVTFKDSLEYRRLYEQKPEEGIKL